VALVLFLLVILFRPEGLLGKSEERKVVTRPANRVIVVVAALAAARMDHASAATSYLHDALLASISWRRWASTHRRLRGARCRSGSGVLRSSVRYIAAIAMKSGWPFLVVLPLRGHRVLCDRPRARLPGAARAAPLPRVRHAGFNVLVFLVMRNEEKITGGTFGISNIPRPSVLGMSTDGHIAFFYFTLASLLVLGALLWYLLRSPWGRAFRGAARQPDPGGEPGSEHHGVHPPRVRDRRRLRGHRRRVLRIARGVHRARPVPFLDVAHDAARGDRRRLGALLRSGRRHDHHHPAARGAARFQRRVAQVHAEVVPRFLRVAVVLLMVWLPGGILSVFDRWKKAPALPAKVDVKP
jgi:branched-chain amino acid transport system permease protein